jgi:hypothetical protein
VIKHHFQSGKPNGSNKHNDKKDKGTVQRVKGNAPAIHQPWSSAKRKENKMIT